MNTEKNEETVDRVKAFAAEKRFLAAKKLLDGMDRAQLGLDENLETLFREIENRAAKAEEVMSNWRKAGDGIADQLPTAQGDKAGNGTGEVGWELGAEMFGTRTYFQMDEESGFISVMMQGQQDELPTFEMMSVINEVDLYKTFIPLCEDSIKVIEPAHGEMVAYFYLSAKVISRDAGIHAYGIDCLQEYGTIVLVGHSIDSFPGADIPFRAAGWGHQTMHVKHFNAVVQVLSPTSAKTTIIATIDPRVALPRTIVNFAIKKLAGVVLWLIQKKALAVAQAKDPTKCPHNQAIDRNTDFYAGWLLPKILDVCSLKGWSVPKVGVIARLIANTPGGRTSTAQTTDENTPVPAEAPAPVSETPELISMEEPAV